MRKWTGCLMTLLPALLLAGCVSGTVGPVEVFSRVEGVAKNIPPESVAQVKRDLQDSAIYSERSALATIGFWEQMQEKHREYLVGPSNPEMLMEQIGKMAANYQVYPYKRSLNLEMAGLPWPYGLKNWRTPMMPGAQRGSVLAGDTRVTAMQACPLWLERVTAAPASPSPGVGAELDSWLDTYSSRLPEIHTFWLSATLTMELQNAYVPRLGQDKNEEFRDQRLVERSTYRLPHLPVQTARLGHLDSVFGRFPAYQKDRARFQAVEGQDSWRLPREHLWGLYNIWSMGLYSKAGGYEWLSEGSYRPNDEKIASTRIYHQQGFAHAILCPMWLPFPLIAKGSTNSYQVTGDRLEMGEQVGSLLSIWPFYVSANGTFFVQDQQKAEIFAAGVPLAYAFGKVESKETGDLFRMHTVLNGNLYAGGLWENPGKNEKVRYHSMGPFSFLLLSTYANAPEKGYMHLAGGWGLLWMSLRNKGELATYHGPLWGQLGWGKNREGKSVIRLLGIPIRVGE